MELFHVLTALETMSRISAPTAAVTAVNTTYVT